MIATKTEFYLTAAGIQSLRDELTDLTTTRRAKIAQSLKEAKEDGDLSENASYDAARDEQNFVEGRISEIEHILKHAKLISAKHTGVVGLGSHVHVELEDGSQKYQIVGPTEANPDEGRISHVSPIGKALLGRKAGDQVEVTVPSGTITYKILNIE